MMIDAHQHFWRYHPEEYPWISDGMEVLMQNFSPADLQVEIDKAGVAGTVAVQSRQTMDETHHLLRMAETNDFIKGVVGWLPIADSALKHNLETMAGHNKLVGIRHVVQDEPDPNFILGKAFNRGIDELKYFGLAYDILVYEHQLPCTISFVDQHPEQVFILDHIAKPKMRETVFIPWEENIRKLAARENVYCKISGMVTEADWSFWTEAQLSPYFEICIDAFGANRLIFGSDWPVCLTAVSYGKWLGTVKEFISKLSSEEQICILSQNAIRAYNLKCESSCIKNQKNEVQF